MKIALHNGDKTNFPNLALMKLSAWHKQNRDEVSWFSYLKRNEYDKIYSSKIFSFSFVDKYLPHSVIKGGYGYNLFNELSTEIEHICPDYSLYNIDYSLGFLTRGCFRNCSWCIVPKKEGSLRKNADLSEFVRHRDVVFMDNNILGSSFGISQIEKIIQLNLRVDFNQGLDARLIDDNIAKLLGKISWLKPIRLSCDTIEQLSYIDKAVKLLRFHNATPKTYFCYVLVTKDIDNALTRISFLRNLCIDPFAQAFYKEGKISKKQKDFCRWVNHKAIFKTVNWEQYGYSPRILSGRLLGVSQIRNTIPLPLKKRKSNLN